MKTILSVFLLCIVMTTVTDHCIAQTYWIRLSGNRVILDARIPGFEGDSLIVLNDGKRIFVPLTVVEEIRTVEDDDILEGAARGVGLGLVIGAAVGMTINPDGDRNWTPGTTALYGAVLGGIVGSVTGSVRSPSVLQVSWMNDSAKKKALTDFIATARAY